MKKKEIAELKKLYTKETQVIRKIAGCYVDEERTVSGKFCKKFWDIDEEEQFKYLDILKKGISGSLGKHLVNAPFEEEKEETHGLLMRLKQSELGEDGLLDSLYEKIAENYDAEGSFVILLACSAYDVPGRAQDGSEMFDASDEVYTYLQCVVCPAPLDKPGLKYDGVKGLPVNRERDRVIGMPEIGFLFPAFTERQEDIHSFLYYTRKTNKEQPAFAEAVFGSTLTVPADSQKETFETFIETAFNGTCTLEDMKVIHENLGEMLEMNHGEEEDLILTEKELEKVLQDTAAKEKDAEKAVEEAMALTDDKGLLAVNAADMKKMTLKTGGVTVTATMERAGRIEDRIVNGQRVLLIPVEDFVEVNGIPVIR